MRLQLSNEKSVPPAERRVTLSVGEIVTYGPVTFGVGEIAEEFFAHGDHPTGQGSKREHT
jgi:hypothetical protein